MGQVTPYNEVRKKGGDMELAGMIAEALVFGAGLAAVYFISISCS